MVFDFFFSHILFFLKDRKKEKFKIQHVVNSFSQIKQTFRSVSKYKVISQFLLARLFFNDALITIFALGGVYAVSILNFSFDEVLRLGIVLNLAAGLGSFFFGYLEDIIGVDKVINITLLTLMVATLMVIYAPEIYYSKELFWFAAVLIGLMVGPNQSCSRSLMAQLTPKIKLMSFLVFLP